MTAGEMPRSAAVAGRLRLLSPVRLSPEAKLALFVGALTLAKLLVAAWTPLASDEALYWRYSKHLTRGNSAVRNLSRTTRPERVARVSPVDPIEHVGELRGGDPHLPTPS